MEKILLIFPSLEKNVEFHHLPLSLLSIAAPLEHRGVKYEIFDERVEDYVKLREKLVGVTMVGITLFTGYQTCRAYEILEDIKSINDSIIIIAGGPHVTSLPEQTLAAGLVDCAVVGYGDEVFCKLVEYITAHGTALGNNIPGVGYLDTSGSIIINKPRNVVNNDYWHNLPYDKIDINKYINPATELVMYVTTYGCPGKCTFCATPCTRSWIQKPIELVTTDLRNLYDLYKFKLLIFNDATLFANKKRIFEILNSLKAFPKIQWCAFSRADEIIKFSKEDLESIKTIGGELTNLTIGLESGSSRVAENIMKKGTNHLVKFEECIRKLVDASIPVLSGLIFGVPGETPEDMENTIKYVSRIRDIYPEFTLSTTFFRPLPGTELFNYLVESGHKLPSSWKEWASHAGQNHYKYNEWMDIPWMSEKEKDEYRKLYDKFLGLHASILI
jgi:anaerobic magnesium-protoporphyrin IX monomethyl ester cyclase